MCVVVTPRFVLLIKHTQASSPHAASPVDFAVYIVGCGPWRNTLVYAILVSQPVQSWTVVRHHDEFLAVAQALQAHGIDNIPPCPSAVPQALVPTAQAVQTWMSTMVQSPAARATAVVQQFFTTAANTLPAMYEGVPWTNFATGPLATATAHTAFRHDAVAEMDMVDMFGGHDEDYNNEGEDIVNPLRAADDLDEDYPRACDRYKPTDETLSEEDEMEILNLDEVEMIEDLGSLAQSLGASHLGRSLQLQAEMMTRPSQQYHHQQQQQKQQQQQQQKQSAQVGLQVGGAPAAAPVGGLGSAMMAAASASVADAPAPPPTPRLDSFKMIKVIGKGSFGEFLFCYCSVMFSVFLSDNWHARSPVVYIR